jgi:hypothetical protein
VTILILLSIPHSFTLRILGWPFGWPADLIREFVKVGDRGFGLRILVPNVDMAKIKTS